ncbi:hypothetical protein [Pedobacter cryophilus]|uniref:Uncharacterized protein n=1 Tax=Pedobacter cryophilus TaxID=2571271 RepID=A0A4U1BWF1_9SPHI|nr:hypothetical protein [Pedobacter cryophilus]TKB95165.1 hypothetical protein FA046_17065 [Pedobacter cryophilus]
MKKLMILFAGLLILGVSSCRKVTEQYYTVPNKTIFYSVNASSWTTTDGGFTYSASLSFLQGDSYVNTYDGLLVYVSYDNGNNYISVPQTYNGLAYSYSASNSKVVLEVQSSDFNQVIQNPGVLSVKVVMIPSEE